MKRGSPPSTDYWKDWRSPVPFACKEEEVVVVVVEEEEEEEEEGKGDT